MVDDLPLAPPPSGPVLTLLVGRVTTIKLTYWLGLTLFEAALPLLDPRPFALRFPLSVVAAVVASLATVWWARASARAPDRRVGRLPRSIPTIATTFAATTVVASPASLPLLILERERSLEACGLGTCHGEALLLWLAILIIGTLAIPAMFAASLTAGTARSAGN